MFKISDLNFFAVQFQNLYLTFALFNMLFYLFYVWLITAIFCEWFYFLVTKKSLTGILFLPSWIDQCSDRIFPVEARKVILIHRILIKTNIKKTCFQRIIINLMKLFQKFYLQRSSEAVVQRCSVKKLFLEISQNLQENTCASLFLNKVVRPVTLLKKRLWHRYFPVNFPKFLRTPLFIEHIWWLLLEVNKLQWQLQTHKTEHIKALWETTLLDPVVLRSFTARLV